MRLDLDKLLIKSRYQSYINEEEEEEEERRTATVGGISSVLSEEIESFSRKILVLISVKVQRIDLSWREILRKRLREEIGVRISGKRILRF